MVPFSNQTGPAGLVASRSGSGRTQPRSDAGAGLKLLFGILLVVMLVAFAAVAVGSIVLAWVMISS